MYSLVIVLLIERVVCKNMFELAKSTYVSNEPNTCDGKAMHQYEWSIHVGSSVLSVFCEFIDLQLMDFIGNVIFL